MYTFVYRTFIKFILFCRGQALDAELSSNMLHLHSRAVAQSPLRKMYTFVYRTFIKFMFFCRGQAPDVPYIRECGQFLDLMSKDVRRKK